MIVIYYAKKKFLSRFPSFTFTVINADISDYFIFLSTLFPLKDIRYIMYCMQLDFN